jgi:hypothetical protein
MSPASACEEIPVTPHHGVGEGERERERKREREREKRNRDTEREREADRHCIDTAGRCGGAV